MLKTLIWEQFYRCFSGYFVDVKTGKAKSKSKIIGTFVLFGVLMLFLCVSFFGMAVGLEPLLETKESWLYFALLGLMTITLGTFASVFNAANSLYNSKDNDLLLSLPIKPSQILISRVALIFGLCFLYSFLVWIPTCVYHFIYFGFNFGVFILDLLLLIDITLFASVLSCAIGFIIAKISSKTKNKSIITVIL